MIKGIFKIIGIFIIGMIGGIFAEQIFWPYFIERPLFYKYIYKYKNEFENQPIYVTETKEIVIQENTALKNAIEKIEKAVVGIRSETQKGKIIEGSGLIVTSDGLVVTLAELIPEGGKFNFFVEGIKTKYQVLKRDLKENLALVKVEKTNLPTLAFADYEKLKLGERVFLTGMLFDKENLKKNVNEGIVKSFDEKLIRTNMSETKIITGSLLANIEGEILGLCFIEEEKVVATPVPKIKKFISL